MFASGRVVPAGTREVVRGLAMPWAIGIVCLVLVWVLVVRRVGPYFDTSFQIVISRTPTISSFAHSIRADNQGPAAQFLFWLGARLGLSTVAGQRLLSLTLASLGYFAAALLGVRWGARGNALFDRARDFTYPALAVALAPGVVTTSDLVRYSSLVGPFWLLAFLLVLRALSGDERALPRLGLSLGIGALFGYTTAVLGVCAVACLAIAKVLTKRANLVRFLRGIVIGAVPVAVWLLLAFAQAHRVVTRVDPSGVTDTPRALVGKAYELGAWLFVGPASLPSVRGTAILFATVAALVPLAWLATRALGSGAAWAVGTFALLPIPLWLLTNVAVGWSMAGPTSVLVFAAALPVVSARRGGALAASALLIVLTLLSTRQAFDLDILRPLYFANAAPAAVRDAGRYAHEQASAIVAGDTTVQLLLGDRGLDAGNVVDVSAIAADCTSLRPLQVIMILQDPGSAAAEATLQLQARTCLRSRSFREITSTEVGRYDALRLRERLRIVARPSQYIVEVWRPTGM